MGKYYLQNCERGHVGNCLLWWRKGGHGYTTNLDDAEQFELEQLADVLTHKGLNDRPKFKAWAVEAADGIAQCWTKHVCVCAYGRSHRNPRSRRLIV